MLCSTAQPPTHVCRETSQGQLQPLHQLTKASGIEMVLDVAFSIVFFFLAVPSSFREFQMQVTLMNHTEVFSRRQCEHEVQMKIVSLAQE